MDLTVKGQKSIELNNNVVSNILNLYSEEALSQRDIFKQAFINNSIEYKDLREECDKLLLPWQYFLLDENQFKTITRKIQNLRIGKVSPKLLAKRRGEGSITSKRIIDRLIRCQEFVTNEMQLPQNCFCGLLKNDQIKVAAQKLIEHFQIDLDKFRSYTKEHALDYLIKQIEDKHINISLGVFDNNKLLPYLESVRQIYRNTSGFVIKDDKLPFVFLPAELNQDEATARRIYTLLYLVVIIGLELYDYSIDEDFVSKIINSDINETRIHNIVSEVLLPTEVTDRYKNTEFTITDRDLIASNFKLTPTAVLTILRKRKIITAEQNDELKTELTTRRTNGFIRGRHISQAVLKFNGKYTVIAVNQAVRNGHISGIDAQQLIFGRINKSGYKEYLNSKVYEYS